MGATAAGRNPLEPTDMARVMSRDRGGVPDLDRITLIGTGALATRLGVHLGAAGIDVAIVGTWRAALDRIAADGIALEIDGAFQRCPARAIRLGDELPPAPIVLVLVKSHQTADVADFAARAARPDGLVLTLQNGLGNREALATAAGDERVAVGVTALGASLRGPGVAVAGGSGATALGAPPSMGPRRQLLAALADRLSGLGLEVTLEPDVDALLWRKLAVNCAINPLTAIHGVRNGRLLDDLDLHARMRAAAAEVAEVATALGIAVGRPAAIADLAEEVARRTSTNRSSMLQDVERGATTEIDALCGAVVRRARELGVEAPVNEELRRAVLSLRPASSASSVTRTGQGARRPIGAIVGGGVGEGVDR